MATFDWTCPFCDRDTTITDERHTNNSTSLTIDNAKGSQELSWLFVVCPNSKCKQFTLTLSLRSYVMVKGPSSSYSRNYAPEIRRWSLIPDSSARPMPDYIPKAIVEDYREASSIREASPKASATLARRCIQGMIRDFWGISKANLFDEIAALEEKVEPEVWQAIDAVRKVGNIGAHMEKDINVIVDVDPDEAAKLLALIELLVREWYISRFNRQERVRAVIQLGKKKTAEKAST